jgi:hypothetical protein
MRPRGVSGGRLRAVPGHISGSGLLAVFALAAALAAGAAIRAWSDGGSSNSEGMGQLAPQPPSDRSLQSASGRPRQTKTRASKPGAAGERYAGGAAGFRRSTSGGSRPRSAVRAQTLRSARPAAFNVPGAPTEPLDEIALSVRARRLDAWLTADREPTAANQRHWLYQHAWIVTGASFGWWRGAEALRLLIHIDRRIESRWDIGYRSETVARRALAAVEARAK